MSQGILEENRTVKRVTCEDVARLAGVHKASVSRVLNGSQSISVQTRQKVAEAVRRLNYRPLSAARMLSTQRNETIGLVSEIELGMSYYGASLVEGISLALTDTGQKLAVSSVHAYSSVDVIRDLPLLKSVSVDGLILDVHSLLGSFEEILAELGVPCIFVNPRTPRATNTIMPDDISVARQAVEYLASSGHKKIVYVPCIKSAHCSQYNRIQGYLEAIAAHSLTALPFWQLPSRQVDGGLGLTNLPTHDSGELFKAYLDNHPCTAIITYSSYEMLWIFAALMKIGIRVPDDISLVSCDYDPSLMYMTVPVTGFYLDRIEMGKMAVKMLQARIKNGNRDEQSMLVGGKFQEGGSVATL